MAILLIHSDSGDRAYVGMPRGDGGVESGRDRFGEMPTVRGGRSRLMLLPKTGTLS